MNKEELMKKFAKYPLYNKLKKLFIEHTFYIIGIPAILPEV
jgi:hypothetical protein